VRLLDALQKQGLIERRESEEDRRIKTVHLTAAAQPLIKEITKISAAFRQELIADIPADDLAAAHRVLKTINDKLERL
jgi:MarR family transcriptional regulator for hemolysin